MAAASTPRARAKKTTAKPKAAKSASTTIEIKIGVENSPRELSVEVELTADEILGKLDDATSNGTSFAVQDPKGRYIVVPGAKISYVEIGEPSTRKVGFGVL
ncbi:MAG: DUF3107 domain-containing protein [Candidatus Nanopelagicales bacterium]